MRFSSFVRFDFWSLWSFLSLYRLVFLYICSIRLGITRCAKITTAYSTQHYRPICLETFQSLDKVLHVFVWDWVSFVYNVYLILFYILNVAQRVLFFNLFYCLSAVQLLSTGFPNSLYQWCENICLHQSIIYFSSGVNIQ